MVTARKRGVPGDWLSVVWFDPGGTTGWCVMCVDGDAFLKPGLNLERRIVHSAAGEITGTLESQLDEIIDLVDLWDFAAVGTEDFVLRKYSAGRELLIPVEVNAVLRYWCKTVRRELHVQSPSLAKSTMTDERLRAAKLWTIGSDHARDATRHAMTFMRRCRDNGSLRDRAWPHLASMRDAE